MSEIWNLSTLCRCCHADGHFKSLKLPYQGMNDVEIYDIMLRETLGVSISKPALEASHTICDDCIERLRDATHFKNQVLMCEEKFKVYCQNEQFLATQDVKIELNDDSQDDHCDDIQIDTENYEDDKVEIKKEYSIEVDFGHPIEELKNEKPTEEGNIKVSEVSIASKKASTKKRVKVEKNVTKEKPTEEGNIKVSEVSIASKKASSKKRVKIEKNITKDRRIDDSLITKVETENGTQFSCKTCGEQCTDKQQIKQHIYLKHTPRKCTICEIKLKNYLSLRKHLQRHKIQKFQCRHCEKKFSEQTALTDHIINIHTKQDVCICDICQKQFKNKLTLQRHLRLHYGTNKKKLCEICGKSFNDKSNLESHVQSVHEKLRPHKCVKCGKSYSTKRHLKDHLIMHDGVKLDSPIHTCDICGHMLVDARQMMVHRLKHENKFMCPVCQLVFETFKARKDHLLTYHHKIYLCPICGKGFVGKYSLNRHINDHNGIKRFACEVCNEKFSQKSGLTRHMFRKHNPENNYKEEKTKCDICKKSFRNIVVHIDRHHCNRIACSICGQTYATNSALNRHKAQKHFGRTFDCEVCGKKYMQKSKLNTHRFKVHKIKNEVNNSDSVSENQTLNVME